MVFFFLVLYSNVAALYEENKPIYFVLSIIVSINVHK